MTFLRKLYRYLQIYSIYGFATIYLWIPTRSMTHYDSYGLYKNFQSLLMCISFFSVHSITWSNRNPLIILTRKREEDSTTNLVRHVKSCEGQVVDPSKSIASYAQGSTYNKAELRYLVSHWVFECHRPFAIIDDPPLQCILKMLYAKVETPSQKTVSRDVKEIHAFSKVHVGGYLQVSLIPFPLAVTNIKILNCRHIRVVYTSASMGGPHPTCSHPLG